MVVNITVGIAHAIAIATAEVTPTATAEPRHLTAGPIATAIATAHVVVAAERGGM